MREPKLKRTKSGRLAQRKVKDAIKILTDLGMPAAQRGEPAAWVLLSICGMKPRTPWSAAKNPHIGITPIMDFLGSHYRITPYKENTRESVRKKRVQYFCEAGIARHNSDNPHKPVNSKDTIYQLGPEMLSLVRSFGKPAWNKKLISFKRKQGTLIKRYAKARKQAKIPLKIDGETKYLSPGEHSKLIKQIIKSFGPRYAPGGSVIYIGDTGDRVICYDKNVFAKLGLSLDDHGKMPDVVIYMPDKKWLLLCEAVVSGGTVDSKRHEELRKLFGNPRAGLIFVTAFETKQKMKKHLSDISWETEVWCAESPSHLIHFNGKRFLGPY